MPRDLSAGRTLLATRRVLDGVDLETYDLLYEGIKSWRREVVIPMEVPDDRIRGIVGRILCDAPGLFWVSRTFSILHKGDSTAVLFSYLYQRDEAERMRSEVVEVMRTLAGRELRGLEDDFDIELAVHDFLTSSVRYEDAGRPEDHSIIGPLLHGRGVCDGVAASFNLIMNSLGIDCMTVAGTSRGEAHSWNIAYVGGEPCHVDVTYDLCGSHAYMNLTDGRIGADHQWGSWVRCTSDACDYHVRNGTVFGSERRLRAYLTKHLTDGDVEFRMEPDIGMEAVGDTVSSVMRRCRITGSYGVVAAGLGTYMVRLRDRPSEAGGCRKCGGSRSAAEH